MTIRIEETIESRSLTASAEPNSSRIELEFMCWDDTRPEVDVDPTDVGAAVEAATSASLYGLKRQSINLKSLTKSIFIATVPYGVFEPPKLSAPRFGFSTAGGSEKITHSLATLAAYPATGYSAGVTNYNQAILVTKDGIQGTNRLIPQLSFRVTGYFDPSTWNASQWLMLNDLSATWNLDTWHGWPAKTLFFEFVECAEYELGTGQLVPVTFHFKARKEETVDKGNGIGPFTKDAWDFIWDDTTQVPLSGEKKMGSTIRTTYVEQIYPGADFELLGLGT